MNNYTIILAIGVTAALAAYLLMACNDYRRCRGPKEKRFIATSYTALLGLLILTSHIGVGLFAAIIILIFAYRWIERKRVSVRLFEGIDSKAGRHIRLQ